MQKLAWLKKNKKLAQWTNLILFIGLIGVGSALVVGAVVLVIYQPSWTGFGPDSTKNMERDSTGKITKTVEVEQSGKTLWDLLSVLGVPLSLAILGFWFQQREQKRVDEQAKLEKEIAAADQQEEALQVYFDRLSTLLIDKNLIAIATKVKAVEENQQNTEIADQKELLNAAADVIRARTLSILRQFGKAGERKSSVIQFLIEAEVMSKLGLNFSRTNLSFAKLSLVDFSAADFSDADLSFAKLSNADLSFAKLSNANLSFADLIRADFIHANLSNANLSGANLSGANLSGANLSNANLSGANLSSANLSLAKLSGADLSRTDLNRTNLSHADLSLVNLSRADLSSANLLNADLNGANLSRTKLSSTDLNDADLSLVNGLKTKQLNPALLCKTKLPKRCKLDPNRNCK